MGRREGRSRATAVQVEGRAMKFRPLEDHVIIRPLEAEDRTAGGIVLPDTAKDKSTKGEIVAVGPGRLLKNGRRQEPELRVGDRVLYGKYAGNDVKLDGREYKIVRESEVLAVIE